MTLKLLVLSYSVMSIPATFSVYEDSRLLKLLITLLGKSQLHFLLKPLLIWHIDHRNLFPITYLDSVIQKTNHSSNVVTVFCF